MKSSQPTLLVWPQVTTTPQSQCSGSINTSVLGTQYLTYTATDDDGNIGSKVRTVVVVDTVPPEITLSGTSPMTVEKDSVWKEPGVTVTGGDSGGVNISGWGGDTSSIGSEFIIYTAQDQSNNVRTETRIVQIIDTTAPTITLNGSGNITIERGTTYTELYANASGATTTNLSPLGSVNANSSRLL